MSDEQERRAIITWVDGFVSTYVYEPKELARLREALIAELSAALVPRILENELQVIPGDRCPECEAPTKLFGTHLDLSPRIVFDPTRLIVRTAKTSG